MTRTTASAEVPAGDAPAHDPFPDGAFDAIGFDADDTLWENERFFRMTEEAFLDLLGLSDRQDAHECLSVTQQRNLDLYGFGIKGFTLSMIQTALELTGEDLPGDTVARILELGQEMLRHPVQLRPGAAEVLDRLADRRLILVTKGDVIDQERKIALSGLAPAFERIEIVQNKTPDAYHAVLDRAGIPPARFIMIGNSVVSDILPVLATGGAAVLVPHAFGWAYEQAPEPEEHPRFRRVTCLNDLPPLLGADG